MNKQQLDQNLNKNKIPNAIMLFGENHLFTDLYSQKICSLLSAKEDIFSLYYDEYQFQKAKDYLSQPSLFNPINVLLIKVTKKILKKELDLLIDYTLKNKDTYLIYCYYGEDYKAASYSAFNKKQGAEFIRFFHPFLNEAKQVLKQRARYLNINIDEYTLTHLYVSQNENLLLAYNELNKFQLLTGVIDVDIVDKLSFALGEIKLDKFIYKLLERKPYINELMLLLEKGENEIRILTAINSFIQQLFFFHTHIKLRGDTNSANILGYKLPPSIEKQQANLSMSIKIKQFKQLFTLLLNTELLLKEESTHNNKAILFSTLIKVQHILMRES
jgi:DNA polymerase-3 subunit delta